jgi:hypothetical protein
MNLWKYYNNKSNQLKYPNVLKDILNHTHEKEIAKTNPKWAFEYALKHGKDEELEPVIAKAANYSFKYTHEILHNKPFPLGEPAIAKNAYLAYSYARFILKEPFKLGEPAIATSPWESLFYAKNILEAPFPLGEKAIAKRAEYSKEYTHEVLKKDFYLDGKLICKYEE